MGLVVRKTVFGGRGYIAGLGGVGGGGGGGGGKFKIRQRSRIRWKSLVHFFRGINLLFTGTTSCLVSNCSLEASP